MEKRNIPYIISYIFELLFVFLFALFYRQPLFSVLLLMFLTIPFISLYLTYIETKHLSVSVECKNSAGVMGEDVVFLIRPEHKGHIPLLNCRMDFFCDNLYYKNEKKNEITFPAEKLKDREISLPYTVSYAGMIVFKAQNIYIPDYLHLFTFKKEIDICIEIPVLPNETPVKKSVIKRPEYVGDEDEISNMDGEKSRDVKEIREYRPGDKLRDIHWKLTAKTDEYMVKEYESVKELFITLLPELVKDDLQDTLSSFYSIGKMLVRENEPFYVCVETGPGYFEKVLVTDDSSLMISLYKLYEAPVHEDGSAYDEYAESSGNPGAYYRIRGKLV